MPASSIFEDDPEKLSIEVLKKWVEGRKKAGVKIARDLKDAERFQQKEEWDQKMGVRKKLSKLIYLKNNQ